MSSAGAVTGAKSGASSFAFAIGAALTSGAAGGGAAGGDAPQPSNTAGKAPSHTWNEPHRGPKLERSFNIGTTLHAPAQDTKRQNARPKRHLPNQTRVPPSGSARGLPPVRRRARRRREGAKNVSSFLRTRRRSRRPSWARLS